MTPADGAGELLLADFRYLSDSFWKYEQAGETRTNWFVGVTSATIAALAALAGQQYGPKGEALRIVVLGGLALLLAFGLVTLARLATRNRNTDKCKRGLDAIRQVVKDRFDPEGALLGYYPVDPPGSRGARRRFGGLSHTVAAVNGIVVAAAVAAWHFDSEPGRIVPWAALAAIAAFALQVGYIAAQEGRTRDELHQGAFTHAFGVVYRHDDGVPRYLLVHPSDGSDAWVLAKGHIEPGEGHGEAALREVREEAGVAARLVAPIGQVEYDVQGKEHVKGKAYLMRLAFEAAGGESSRKPQWFTFDEACAKASHAETRALLAAAEATRRARAAAALES